MKNSLFIAALISSSLLISTGGFASDTLDQDPEKKDESLRVKEQKEAGILEQDRNYEEKSEFVKNRDRVEGAVQVAGEAIADGAKDAGKGIEKAVKKLF